MAILRKSLPADRSFEQIENHYLVEKAIAERLKKSSKCEERKLIYATMYDDLFRQVPDHPRLIQRNNEHITRIATDMQISLILKHLNNSTIFLEFAPGDCRFAMEIAGYVKKVYAVDISDQMGQRDNIPKNFTLVVYDGYKLEEIGDNSVDIIFSNQFIEHLHPDDTMLHFELVHRILKSGGVYVFLTPHAFTGPHDISQFFSDSPQGFHLKEWTIIELYRLLRETMFSHIQPVRLAKGLKLRLPYNYIRVCENMLDLLPQDIKRIFARYLIPSICIVATKP